MPRGVYPSPLMTPAARRAIRVGAGRVAARAGVAAAARMAPYLSAASTAYRVGKRVAKTYKKFRVKKTQAKPKTVSRPLPGRWQGVHQGKFVGKFKKPRRSQGRVTRMKTQYQNSGYVCNKEVFGKVDSPDCVYIGHSTWDAPQIAEAIAIAALRKLCRKAGFNADSAEQELPFYAYNDSDGFQLSWTLIRADGSLYNSDYTIPGDTTLSSLATNSGFKSAVQDAMTSSVGTTGNFDRITLRSSDRNGVSTNWRLASELNLKTEVLKIFSKSTLMVQNRTKSASGSSSTDVIDNQPIKGFLYRMVGGVPQPKTMGSSLNRATAQGIILKRAVDLSPAQLYKEPPVPSHFSNCYKSSYVGLQPGDMQRSSIMSQWTGYFNNLVSGKFLQRYTGDAVEFAPGKCELFAMEESLNSGSTNLLLANYEAEKTVGAVLISSKRPTMLAGHSELEINNVTV